ncbi:hypothetical protein CASFOL_002406 [Castilleja foliolosa]|uniref:PGG domain-containing protein n=1 Tax=Castilleja foliolosa TaxID=1961234 RepID=A0ABD3EE74_9LAMI
MKKSDIDKINEARTNAVKIMVKIAKLNKRNSDNHTPLDIALKDKNGHVADILTKANAKTSDQLSDKQTDADYLRSETNILEKAVRGYCFLVKDLTVGMRSVVLVVAVLIATATYQAVLQPPGGFYPADSDSGRNATGLTARRALVAPPPRPSNAGKMMMGEEEYKHFMPANTAAFTLSMVIIIFVLHGRPYNLILHGCLIFLGNSYLVAMKWSSVYKGVCGSLFVLSWSVISAAFALKMMYYVVKAPLFEDVWWLRGGGVTWHNMSYRKDQGPTCQKVMRLLRQLRRQRKLIQRLN